MTLPDAERSDEKAQLVLNFWQKMDILLLSASVLTFTSSNIICAKQQYIAQEPLNAL